MTHGPSPLLLRGGAGGCLANSQCAGSAEAVPLWVLWQFQGGLLSQMMNGGWQASDEDSSTKLESDKCGHHQAVSVRSNDIVEVQFHARLNLALVTPRGCPILGTTGPKAL